MREFVSKQKKIKLTIDGVSYEMKSPSLGETEKLESDIKSANPNEVMDVYKRFFMSLGLADNACNKMDYEDFLDFIGFVINPKSKGLQSTP